MDFRGKVIFALVCGWVAPAAAGELYHPKCCPQNDCHPAVPDAVQQTRDGFFIPEVEETVPAGDARVMLSADGRFHICARSQANPDMGWSQIYVLLPKKRLKCLYVPAMF